jgi:hypothetical protein
MKIPVVLPVVRVTIGASGELAVDVDDEPYGSKQNLHRCDLQPVLDAITTERDSAVRVEIVEHDGTTYADIATPPAVPALPAHEAAGASRVPGHPVAGVTGSGFRPGEQVAVAFVLLHQTADDEGHAVVNLPPAALSGHRASVVLFGLDSEATARIEAPA